MYQSQAFKDGLKAYNGMVSRFANPGGHHRVSFRGCDYATDWDNGWREGLRLAAEKVIRRLEVAI